MESIHDSGVSVIEWLQTRLGHQSEFFCIVSNIFSPRHVFFLLAPVVFSLDRKVGKRVLLVAILSEWVSQLTKWILQGERPYWWIHETTMYTGGEKPNIRQYYATCETAPGTPSAHVVCTVSVWYVIIESLLHKFTSKRKRGDFNRLFLWSAYVFVVATVCVSRVFLATHFPHQCVLGLIIGHAIIVTTRRFNFDDMKFKHYVELAIGLFCTSAFIYFVLMLTGRDPVWSLRKAVKWCNKQKYVDAQTIPFYYVMRYCGFALGMGLALNSVLHKKVSGVKFTNGMKVANVVLCICTINMCEIIVSPVFGVSLYAGVFCLSVTVAYSYVTLVPFVVRKLWPHSVHAIKSK